MSSKDRINDWINKAKKSVNDVINETQIQSEFNSNNQSFEVYTKSSSLINSFTIHGFIEINKITYYGEKDIPVNSVIIDENNKAYYVTDKKEKTTIEISFQGNTYIKPGISIVLDENVVEVNVIKAGTKYFLYKEKDK